MRNDSEDGRSHIIGVLFVLGSAIAFSFAGVLTKTVESDGWTVVCWRGLFSIPLIILYVMWQQRNHLVGRDLIFGWRGWTLATVGSLTSIAFISSFKLTFVANVVIIYATVPFVAAGLSWFALHEKVRVSTLLAAVGAFVGVVVMVSGGTGTGHIAGNFLAVLMTVSMACYMVLVRVFRRTPAVLAVGASSVQLFVTGWIFSDPFAVSVEDIILLALFGLSFALGAILITEGARLIPAAEAGLLGTADTPLAVLLAWYVLAELPPFSSFVGGAIVLAAVLTHAARDLVRHSAKRQRELPK